MKHIYYYFRRWYRWLFWREILDAINAGLSWDEVNAIARRGEV